MTASTTVAIAGAGIAGLATALALSRSNIRTKIYERRDSASEAGAGIQLGPNATGVLARFGVLNAVEAVAFEPTAINVHDAASGRSLARMPLGRSMRVRFGAPYLTVHRQDLHRVLLDAVSKTASAALLPGHEVLNFSNQADGVELKIRHHEKVNASALIAADGLWSTLRTAITPCSSPMHAGKCAYRAVVPNQALPDALASNEVHIWLSPGAHVVHYPVRQGREVAIVAVIDGIATHHGWDSAASADALMHSPIAGFAASVRELLSAAQEWRMWPLQRMEAVTRWTNGAAALIGDAAHPILPFFAQGGGLAIEDAAVLADCMAYGSGAIREKLAAFEAARKARVRRVADASLRNGRIYHLSGVGAVARNTVLSLVPAHLLMRRYDWLYGWKPD